MTSWNLISHVLEEFYHNRQPMPIFFLSHNSIQRIKWKNRGPKDTTVGQPCFGIFVWNFCIGIHSVCHEILSRTCVRKENSQWLYYIWNKGCYVINYIFFRQQNYRRMVHENHLKMTKWMVLNPLPKNNILDWSKLKAFADYKIMQLKNRKSFMGWMVHIAGKRRICWLPAVSPFSIMFSKDFSFSVIKRPDCVV